MAELVCHKDGSVEWVFTDDDDMLDWFAEHQSGIWRMGLTRLDEVHRETSTLIYDPAKREETQTELMDIAVFKIQPHGNLPALVLFFEREDGMCGYLHTAYVLGLSGRAEHTTVKTVGHTSGWTSSKQIPLLRHLDLIRKPNVPDDDGLALPLPVLRYLWALGVESFGMTKNEVAATIARANPLDRAEFELAVSQRDFDRIKEIAKSLLGGGLRH